MHFCCEKLFVAEDIKCTGGGGENFTGGFNSPNPIISHHDTM